MSKTAWEEVTVFSCVLSPFAFLYSQIFLMYLKKASIVVNLKLFILELIQEKVKIDSPHRIGSFQDALFLIL